MSETYEKLARWRLRFSEFEFPIGCHAGIKHEAADAMSRLLTDGIDKIRLDDDVVVLPITTKLTNTDETKHEKQG